MDNDDRPVGRLLTRREMLKLLTAVGAATAAGCAPRLTGTNAATTAAPAATNAPAATTAASIPTATLGPATAGPTVPATEAVAATKAVAATEAVAAATEAVALPTCVVRPEMTEGPYFVDEQLNRSDIREDPSDGSIREGALLALAFRVSRIDGTSCAPLAGAMVDVWHCDAAGVYSDVQDNNFGNTTGQKFLRGYQLTDANGAAAFTTIYPGWYRGRTVHIHFKIRTEENGGQYEFTSQLFFDDAFTDAVYTAEPYAATGQRDTRNENDGIFRDGGDQLTLAVQPNGDGYAAVFDIGLQV